jgi:rubrerythrin
MTNSEAELYKKAVQVPNAVPSEKELIRVCCFRCGYSWLSTQDDFIDAKCPICGSEKTVWYERLKE